MTFQVMTPREIVGELDRFIIGQNEAKRAVAIALRNRWRRMQLEEDLRKEITPKNILMIGPTGVGKTEIARRLAELSGAPFIKVEATKFTEVGYVGRDVESIIRDLMERSIKMVREKAMQEVRVKAEAEATEKVLDILVPEVLTPSGDVVGMSTDKKPQESATRKLYRQKLEDGELDERDIEIDLQQSGVGLEVMVPPGMEEMVGQIQNMVENMSSKRTQKKRLKIKIAMKQLIDEAAMGLINEDDIKERALESVEQNGIVFIDEVDKIVKPNGVASGGEVSREGVQRDLLPLVEGCSVNTKYGMVKTDHILFIASGAFHLSKPSDLVPELQGRFPIRVELSALTIEDLTRILTEPKASLTEQYVALMKTEDFTIKFTKLGIKRIADIAFRVNNTSENIGARRLHTILERLLDKASFDCSDQTGGSLSITAKYVDEQLAKIAQDEDLSQYIL